MLSLKIEKDENGEINFGTYRCVATNDHGNAHFDIEIEDKDYARSRTMELMIIVGVASKNDVVVVVVVKRLLGQKKNRKKERKKER